MMRLIAPSHQQIQKYDVVDRDDPPHKSVVAGNLPADRGKGGRATREANQNTFREPGGCKWFAFNERPI